MHIETLPISELRCDPANARKHPRRNMDALIASLTRFGQQKPVVIDAGNVVRAGNATLAAARALGWTELAVVRTPLEELEATAFAIADNRTAELAEWDNDVLALQLKLPEIGDLGFSDDEIDRLLVKPDADLDRPALEEKFQVLVDCENEEAQREVYEKLSSEGYPCRVLTV